MRMLLCGIPVCWGIRKQQLFLFISIDLSVFVAVLKGFANSYPVDWPELIESLRWKVLEVWWLRAMKTVWPMCTSHVPSPCGHLSRRIWRSFTSFFSIINCFTFRFFDRNSLILVSSRLGTSSQLCSNSSIGSLTVAMAKHRTLRQA